MSLTHDASSRLLHPRAFLRSAWLALRSSQACSRRLFIRSLNHRYRYSWLGWLWVLAPALVTGTLLALGQRRGLLSPQSGSGLPLGFFGVFGITVIQTFLESLQHSRSIFLTHQSLLRRDNVPLEGLIGACLLETLFAGLARLLVLGAAFLYFQVPIAFTAPMFLASFAGMALAGAGAGLWIAPLNTLKRDGEHLFALLPWLLFAVTPVFAPLPSQGFLARLARLNPLMWICDGLRGLAYGSSSPTWPALACLLLGPCLLVSGWLHCRFWRPYVVERLLI